jgi:hypothetical protein
LRGSSTHQRRTVLLSQVDAVHELAVNVELDVVGGTVTDTHGLGSLVPVEVGELELGQILAAVDCVDADVRI